MSVSTSLRLMLWTLHLCNSPGRADQHLEEVPQQLYIDIDTEFARLESGEFLRLPENWL